MKAIYKSKILKYDYLWSSPELKIGRQCMHRRKIGTRKIRIEYWGEGFHMTLFSLSDKR